MDSSEESSRSYYFELILKMLDLLKCKSNYLYEKSNV
jgi:hypothetical protein